MRTTLWALGTVAKYGCGKGYGTGPGKAPDCVKHAKEVIGKFTSSADKTIAEEAKNNIKDLSGLHAAEELREHAQRHRLDEVVVEARLVGALAILLLAPAGERDHDGRRPVG